MLCCASCLAVQGESSTGTHQALGDGLGAACKEAGTLLVVDTVAALGGVPCFADAWGIDAIYSGSQKCLSAPPGAAPLFFSQRAVDKLKGRKTKPATYNLDLNLIGEGGGLAKLQGWSCMGAGGAVLWWCPCCASGCKNRRGESQQQAAASE